MLIKLKKRVLAKPLKVFTESTDRKYEWENTYQSKQNSKIKTHKNVKTWVLFIWTGQNESENFQHNIKPLTKQQTDRKWWKSVYEKNERISEQEEIIEYKILHNFYIIWNYCVPLAEIYKKSLAFHIVKLEPTWQCAFGYKPQLRGCVLHQTLIDILCKRISHSCQMFRIKLHYNILIYLIDR